MRARITKKRIAYAVSLLLVGVLAAVGAVGYLTFVRSPVNPPSQACDAGPDADRGPVVVAAGASMTQGTLGADWVGALRAKPEFAGYELVNAGVNGSTSADLRDRTGTDIVACHPDAVVILVGTNDVRDGVPVESFQDNLTAIVDRIAAETTAQVALMSLPPLGENLDAEINHRLSGYNEAIAAVATAGGADYLPLHERMADQLRQRENPGSSYDFSFTLAFRAAAQHYLFRRSWDDVARSHGLELLVDHIHLSDRGGAIVTELATRWLTTAAL